MTLIKISYDYSLLGIYVAAINSVILLPAASMQCYQLVLRRDVINVRKKIYFLACAVVV